MTQTFSGEKKPSRVAGHQQGSRGFTLHFSCVGRISPNRAEGSEPSPAEHSGFAVAPPFSFQSHCCPVTPRRSGVPPRFQQRLQCCRRRCVDAAGRVRNSKAVTPRFLQLCRAPAVPIALFIVPVIIHNTKLSSPSHSPRQPPCCFHCCNSMSQVLCTNRII